VFLSSHLLLLSTFGLFTSQAASMSCECCAYRLAGTHQRSTATTYRNYGNRCQPFLTLRAVAPVGTTCIDRPA
jgi:hypothetical protein